MKFGKLAMPQNKEKEMPEGEDMGMDLFGGESMEDEGSEEDVAEDKAELSQISDDELLAECKKRGLSLK